MPSRPGTAGYFRVAGPTWDSVIKKDAKLALPDRFVDLFLKKGASEQFLTVETASLSPFRVMKCSRGSESQPDRCLE